MNSSTLGEACEKKANIVRRLLNPARQRQATRTAHTYRVVVVGVHGASEEDEEVAEEVTVQSGVDRVAVALDDVAQDLKSVLLGEVRHLELPLNGQKEISNVPTPQQADVYIFLVE